MIIKINKEGLIINKKRKNCKDHGKIETILKKKKSIPYYYNGYCSEGEREKRLKRSKNPPAYTIG